MKSVIGRLRNGILFTSLWCSVGAVVNGRALSADDPPRAPCAAPAYHQFDFWLGDWDVFEVGSPTKVAHARVDSILDGCVLREDYQGADGHKGQSFTIYDASRSIWHQTWVTNRGELLEIEGNIENGEMVLSGKNQQGALVRGRWKPVNGEVREIAVTSRDDGKSWEPWFDLMFRRSASNAPATGASASYDARDDNKTVAALDTQYQEAVKQSDAATMVRILADNCSCRQFRKGQHQSGGSWMLDFRTCSTACSTLPRMDDRRLGDDYIAIAPVLMGNSDR